MNNFDFVVSNINSLKHSVVVVNNIAFLNYDSEVLTFSIDISETYP